MRNKASRPLEGHWVVSCRSKATQADEFSIALLSTAAIAAAVRNRTR